MPGRDGMTLLFDNFENVIEPKECKLVKSSGAKIPSYLKGTMVRNGPGMFEIGGAKYKHWFDGLGYIQRYHFEDGKMYYSARFLESEAYLENTSKNRIIRSSFGTASFPDPCKTLFSRFFSTFFQNDEKHDNANVSFTPIGDQVYACTETPHMYRIDMRTLETKDPVDTSKYITLHTCTAHHTIDEQGNVFNVGSRFGKDSSHVFTKTVKPAKFQNGQTDWEQTSKIGEIKCSNAMSPTYMHSFGMSQNYIVMFEAPVRINLKTMLMRNVTNSTYHDSLYWDDKKDVNVFIMNKNTGESQTIKYTSAPFFTFHHANTFEKDGCLVVDYCRIEESGNFDLLLIENLKTGTFHNTPKFLPYLTRLIIPLEVPESSKTGQNLLEKYQWAKGCTAVLQDDGSVRLTEKRLCETSMEFPRYHWEKFNMKEYKYCFGSNILSDLNSSEMTGVVKVDVTNGQSWIWRRENHDQICGEPIFVPDPHGVDEDDGILVVPVMVTDGKQKPFVLVLDATSMLEIARFEIPEKRIPLGFHAFYQSNLKN